MAYIQAHAFECAIGLAAVLILAGIVVIGFLERRLVKMTAETEEKLLRRMNELAEYFSHERLRMERELKSSYDATNRVVAELVRSQQTRLDAFSGQIASWKPSSEAKSEPDARIEELIGEVRRAREAMLDRENSMQAFATREELGAYFTGLSEDVRRVADEIRTMPLPEAQESGDMQLQQIFERAQNEIALFNAALDSTKKHLKQTNESMEDAARCSKKFQKKIKRAVGGDE